MYDSNLGNYDETPMAALGGEFEHSAGAENLVGTVADLLTAFRMCNDYSAGVFLFGVCDVGLCDPCMGQAVAGPQYHLPARFLDDVAAEVPVGHKDDLSARRQRLDQFKRVAAGAAVVA